jgi:hypothetical protein
MAMMKKTTTMSGDPMKRAINKASRIEKRGATPTGGVSMKAQQKAVNVYERAVKKGKISR